MPSSRTRALNLRDYAVGETALAESALPDWCTDLGFEVSRALWSDESRRIRVRLEVSYDGGQTWQPGGEFEDTGGVHLGKDGLPLTNSRADWSYFPGTNRVLRGTFTISGGSVMTEAFFELRG